LLFVSCQMLTDVSIQTLSEGIMMLPLLENVDLAFAWCQNFTDVALITLSKALGSLTLLKRVYLNFSS